MSENKNGRKFNLVITPAVPVELIHKMQKFLQREGYSVSGSGQFVDESSCDISFEEKE